MLSIDVYQAKTSLTRIRKGIMKYISIMRDVKNTDVSVDENFQRKFTGFYRIRRSKADFCKAYYAYMEKQKNVPFDFQDVITYFFDNFHRLEASFSSKLLATLNPNMPVWDSKVLKRLGLKAPPQYSTNRLQQAIELYGRILAWYNEYMQTDNCKEVIRAFDELYPQSDITNVKKIDLVLWALQD